MKRNVKFDDEKLDLVLDLKLNANTQWKKIPPAEAIQVKNLGSGVAEDELDSDAVHSFIIFHNTSGEASVSGANSAPLGGGEHQSGSNE